MQEYCTIWGYIWGTHAFRNPHKGNVDAEQLEEGFGTELRACGPDVCSAAEGNILSGDPRCQLQATHMLRCVDRRCPNLWIQSWRESPTVQRSLVRGTSLLANATILSKSRHKVSCPGYALAGTRMPCSSFHARTTSPGVLVFVVGSLPGFQ